MGKEIFVSNSFLFHFVFYFISGYYFLLVYFFSLAAKTLSRPNLFRTSENSVPLFSVASRLGSCCIILKKSTSKNQSMWPPPAYFFSLMSNECFLFQFHYYSLKEDKAIQVSLKPELFRYKNANSL